MHMDSRSYMWNELLSASGDKDGHLKAAVQCYPLMEGVIVCF